jgi:hypothetical protein
MSEPIVELNTPEGERLRESLYQKLPLLVEVSFARCGTSSDWHLCSTDEQLDDLLTRLPAGRVLFAVSVDELKQEGRLCVRL